ncbi:MAG: peptide-methionine (S)-S-oxide reductase [Bradymonadia bacterium]|jgi:peptide-methionine (S)-S-oxide reductase
MSTEVHTQTIALGGGCHWCTEAVFQSLRGVSDVRQGFVASLPPNDTLSEAVVVNFDPARITLKVLIDVHLRTHASASNHVLRSRYRSAVYTYSLEQRDEATNLLVELAAESGATYVTAVLPFGSFVESDERYQNYYATDAERPFCQRHIDPKLARIRAEFEEYVAPEPF